ncbi:GNAT family N-acetyltransferase [Sulfitobacter alexandrii]|uniref:GNAT family N-acetyltransferase n=1 Tax=Sulfitobacter alexandrii TaxID=1917485 RepID=A0A1J0WKE9_9RHOB|nr:GNAT family N-acetyltransferase [Sulfitobacter alexandrii]APE44779.1 GNAT family N-acetyltransferase [Sulfitobacter alexandrii]
MELTPRRLRAQDPDLPAILALIRRAFAPMEGRIDPPSSMLRMTLETLRAEAETAEVWSLGAPPLACVILTPKPAALYLGKLAVDPDARRLGLARHLIDHAERRARALRLPAVELQCRVELVENHALFAACGYAETDRTAHPGFDRPTSITFARTIGN